MIFIMKIPLIRLNVINVMNVGNVINECGNTKNGKIAPAILARYSAASRLLPAAYPPTLPRDS
jgi:hypothetical protein